MSAQISELLKTDCYERILSTKEVTDEWQPYDKIPYQLTEDKNSRSKASTLRWAATEKIHGAHMAVLCNSQLKVSFAKRSRILRDDESFFQYQRISDSLSRFIRSLWVEIMVDTDAFSDIETKEISASKMNLLSVHGELCGGYYPHPSLISPSAPGLQPVQTGLWYSPNLHFVAYDIAIYCGGVQQWLPFEITLRLAAAAGFLVLKPLFVGCRAEAMSFPTRFSSLLPAQLGLPPLDECTEASLHCASDSYVATASARASSSIRTSTAKKQGRSQRAAAIVNLAEGIVVRPFSDRDHTLVKIKNKEFAEIADDIDFDSMGRSDIGFILGRINDNRIAAARSKTGAVGDVEDSDLIDAVVDDVITEICSEGSSLSLARVAALTAEETMAIREYILSLM